MNIRPVVLCKVVTYGKTGSQTNKRRVKY